MISRKHLLCFGWERCPRCCAVFCGNTY